METDFFGVVRSIKSAQALYLGYVYELPTSQISKMTSQSHELALRVRLAKK
jgi:hypothetical protein